MSTRPDRCPPADPAPHRSATTRALSRFCAAAVAAATLGVLAPGAAGHLAATVPWQPTDEDLGADSGPDPGTCEAMRTCPTIPK